MAGILDELRGGDRRTLGRSAAVAEKILRKASLLAELTDAFDTDDRVLLARSADCLEKVAAEKPELVQPYKDIILRVMGSMQQWEVREHVCLLLPRLKLTASERREAFHKVRGYLDDNSSIVRTFAMQAMYDLSGNDEPRRDEVMEVIDRAVISGTAAMRARARQLVKKGRARRPVPSK